MIKLTKEQEESIEQLKQRLEPKKYGGYCALGYNKKYRFRKSDLQAIETVLNLIQEQKKDMEKKGKIIDLMAETISEITTDIPIIIKQFEEKYCEFINSDDDCCWKTDKSCKDCVKQYFENKAKM